MHTGRTGTPGLTRDGAFQKPKLGMLDYIVSSKRDPEFAGPLVIIPTAINFDRVLEDRNLTEELIGKDDRRTKGEKLSSSLTTARTIPGRARRRARHEPETSDGGA